MMNAKSAILIVVKHLFLRSHSLSLDIESIFMFKINNDCDTDFQCAKYVHMDICSSGG